MPKLFSIRFRGIALFLMLWSTACSCAGSAFAAELERADAVVPFTLHSGHLIVVKCSIGGLRDLTAVIDTGATETVLDMEVVRKLSLAVQPDSATFITHQAKVWAVSIPGLQLGSITATHLEGIATDLSSLTADLGFRPQVLIGMDVLSRASFLIDYPARRLVFSQVAQGPVPQLLLGWKPAHSTALMSSPLEESGLRFAVIEASVAGKTLRLQVDSGFEGLLLYSDRLPALYRDRMASSASGQSHIANVAQAFTAQTLDATVVQIGDWRAPRAEISVLDGPVRSHEFDGLIGTAFLSKTRVAFDFQNGMIWWE